LFDQHELTANVLLKEAIWRLSGGRFELFLPQSKEQREPDRPDVEAYIRNDDLVALLKADLILARFDGLELDSGTVVEYMVAKNLGKPAVLYRSDLRRPPGTGQSELYNLMVKNWPRTIELYLDAFVAYSGLLGQERAAGGGSGTFQAEMEAELGAAHKSVDQLAQALIAGMEAALVLESPYPPEYQELVYRAARYAPGSGFDQMLGEAELDEIIDRLRANGTL
jgi:nucleoside 2-deoxyribosyltransferase